MPEKPEGDHAAPKKDATILITVTDANGKAVKIVCPGVSYGLNVSYPEERQSLVFASVGTLDAGKGEVLKSLFACPNRFVSPKAAGEPNHQSLEITWAVPCNASGPAKVSVTSATGSRGAFFQNSLTTTVAALADCPTSTCPSAVAAAAKNATTTAAGTAAATAASPATPAAAPSPSPAPAKAQGAADRAGPLGALAVVIGTMLAAFLA